MVIKWALTNKCNLSCRHCYNSELRNSHEFNENDVIRIVDEFSKNYVSGIQFLGGEPLLAKSLLVALKYCYENKINAEINTNGTLFDDAIISAICEYKVSSVTFSIDGYNCYENDEIRGNGTFNKSVSNLHLLGDKVRESNNNTLIYINSVIGRETIKNPSRLFRFLEEFPFVAGITISIPDIVGSAIKQNSNYWPTYAEFLEYVIEVSKMLLEFKGLTEISFGVPARVKNLLNLNFGTKEHYKYKIYCMGASSVYTLDADGILYPCNLTHGIEWFRNKYGYEYLLENLNIFNKNFYDLYTSNEYLEFYKYVRSKDLCIRDRIVNKVCSSCDESIYCQVACPLENDIIAMSELCKLALIHPQFK